MTNYYEVVPELIEIPIEYQDETKPELKKVGLGLAKNDQSTNSTKRGCNSNPFFITGI